MSMRETYKAGYLKLEDLAAMGDDVYSELEALTEQVEQQVHLLQDESGYEHIDALKQWLVTRAQELKLQHAAEPDDEADEAQDYRQTFLTDSIVSLDDLSSRNAIGQ